jgi:hypothetical protein
MGGGERCSHASVCVDWSLCVRQESPDACTFAPVAVSRCVLLSQRRKQPKPREKKEGKRKGKSKRKGRHRATCGGTRAGTRAHYVEHRGRGDTRARALRLLDPVGSGRGPAVTMPHSQHIVSRPLPSLAHTHVYTQPTLSWQRTSFPQGMCGRSTAYRKAPNSNSGYIPLPGRRWPGPFHPPWCRCTSRTGGQRQPARCGRTAGCKGVGVGACIVMHCNVKRGGSVASAMHQPRPPLHMECGSKRKAVVGRTSQRQREGQVPPPPKHRHTKLCDRTQQHGLLPLHRRRRPPKRTQTWPAAAHIV